MFFMKRMFCILALIIVTAGNALASTPCSKFLEDKYSKEYPNFVKLVSKKEHVDICEQEIGSQYIYAIGYGVGYMKVRGQRRMNISYICILDENNQPLWGQVMPR